MMGTRSLPFRSPGSVRRFTHRTTESRRSPRRVGREPLIMRQAGCERGSVDPLRWQAADLPSANYVGPGRSEEVDRADLSVTGQRLYWPLPAGPGLRGAPRLGRAGGVPASEGV